MPVGSIIGYCTKEGLWGAGWTDSSGSGELLTYPQFYRATILQSKTWPFMAPEDVFLVEAYT